MRSVMLAALLACPLIAHADDARSRYARPFTPAWAAPQLDLDPPGGPPGTEVEITGSKLSGGVAAYYGDQPMQVIEQARGHVVVVIPRHAHRDDYIYLVDNLGRARTQVPFALERRHRQRFRYEPRYEPRYDRPYWRYEQQQPWSEYEHRGERWRYDIRP